MSGRQARACSKSRGGSGGRRRARRKLGGAAIGGRSNSRGCLAVSAPWQERWRQGGAGGEAQAGVAKWARERKNLWVEKEKWRWSRCEVEAAADGVEYENREEAWDGAHCDVELLRSVKRKGGILVRE